MDWTADSKAVIVISNRDGHAGVFKQSLDGEMEEPVLIGPRDGKLSPDGSWLLYLAPIENVESRIDRLMRVPIAGGPSEFVLEAKMNNYRCTKSPAGLCVFCELSEDRKQLIFTTLDPLKGREKNLFATAPIRMRGGITGRFFPIITASPFARILSRGSTSSLCMVGHLGASR